MTAPTSPAPAIEAVQWFNTDTPPSLDALRGRVVVIEPFQMLCPGSVSHGMPQASRIHETFSRDDVVVLGLHRVFEHHEAQRPQSLAAFFQEHRIAVPDAVDPPEQPGSLPITVARDGWRGGANKATNNSK